MALNLDRLNEKTTEKSSGLNLDRLQPKEEPIQGPTFPSYENAKTYKPEISFDVSKAPLSQAAESFTEKYSHAPELPGRDIPVIGTVLRGLDKLASNPVSQAIAENTVPNAPFIGEPGTNARDTFLQDAGQFPSTGASKFIGAAAAPFFVPGAQLGTGTAATEASQAALNRLAPKLQGIGQAGAREGLAGGAIGFGSEYAQGTGDLGEAAKSGALGAVLGGGIGGAIPAIGRGISAASNTAGRDLMQGLERGSVAKQLSPTMTPEQISTIADEGLSRLAPETNPNIVQFDPLNPMRSAESEVAAARQATQVVDTPISSSVESVQHMTPITEVTTAKPTTRNRQLIDNTFLGSEKLTPELRSRLETSGTRKLDSITNLETVQNATQRIGRGIDEAEAFALGGKGAVGAEQVTTGFRLIDEFQRTGQIQRAVTMAELLAEKLTNAGQTVQAASIWNRLTPEGALVYAQRKVNQINTELPNGSQHLQINEKTASDIMGTAEAIQRAGVSQQRAADVMNILDRIKAGEDVSNGEKQIISDFIKDAKQFVEPAKSPRPARTPKEMSDTRVRDNVVSFLDAQEKAAKDRLRARGIQISSNPLDVWADYAVIGASKLGKGAVKFADWSEQMVKDFGENVRPHLNEIYNRAQDYLSVNAKRISEDTISNSERIADNYLKKNEANLKPSDIDLIRGMAKKVSGLSGDAKRLANQDLQAILNGFEKAGVGKKLSSAQYVFMLLNPITQVRNVVGNELMYRLERLNRWTSAPIDWAASKLTGSDRQITALSGPASWENFFAPTMDYLKGLREGSVSGWRGVNPEGLTTAYDINGQAFKSKLNPLTYLEKSLGAVMKGFDYAAFNRATQQRLRESAYLDAMNKGVNGKDNIQRHIDRYMVNLDDNLSKVAQDYGKYITLQDSTPLATALNSTKRGLNSLSTGFRTKDFGAGNFIIPFAKTPANLLMRAIDYSPIGFAKAIMQTHDIIRKPNVDLTRADVIQSVTRALLGTGLTGVGLWLADKGVLRGESSNDRDVRELEKLAGLSQYQINATALQRVLGAMVTGNMKDVDAAGKPQPGDTFWQYEWAQPTSIPLALGANIIQERKQATKELLKSGKSESFGKQTYDVTTGALNTLFNTSVLQGLVQAFDFPPGEENKFKSFLQNIVKQVPSMAVPSIVNRINQVTDPTIRETFDKGFLQGAVNPALSKVPGLSQQFPQRVNTLGQPQTRENGLLDSFILPAQRSIYKPSEQAKLVIDLLAETGDDRIAPRAVPKYITGTDHLTKKSKKVDLNAEQLVKYQQIVGEETVRLLSRLPENLTTQKKVDRVIDILGKAGDKGRTEMRKELGLR